MIRFQWGHRRIRPVEREKRGEGVTCDQHELTVVQLDLQSPPPVKSGHVTQNLCKSARSRKFHFIDEDVEDQSQERLIGGTGGNLGEGEPASRCHLESRSVTMSCHQVMHLLHYACINYIHCICSFQPCFTPELGDASLSHEVSQIFAPEQISRYPETCHTYARQVTR